MIFAAWILVMAAASGLSSGVHPDQCELFGYTVDESASGITKEQKKAILKLHNKIRRRVANGERSGSGGDLLPTASNMNKVTWDNDLAEQAQEHANFCFFEKDIKKQGVNLLVELLTGEESIKEAIEKWENKADDFEVSTVDSYDNTASEFVQLVWAETQRIGCGFSVIELEEGLTKKLLVCNYSPGRARREPVYLKGESGSKCSSMGRKNKNGLCV